MHDKGRSSKYISTMVNRGRDAVLIVIRCGAVFTGGRQRGVRLKLSKMGCSADCSAGEYRPVYSYEARFQVLSARDCSSGSAAVSC